MALSVENEHHSKRGIVSTSIPTLTILMMQPDFDTQILGEANRTKIGPAVTAELHGFDNGLAACRTLLFYFDKLFAAFSAEL